MPLPRLVLRAGRRLALLDSGGVPRKDRLNVRIAFGLHASTTVPILSGSDPADNWGFLDDFDLRQPWAQRDTMSFCRDFPIELRVVELYCWMGDLRNYARDKLGRFPLRPMEFNDVANRYAVDGAGATRGPRYIWLVGEEVQAMFVSAYIDVHSKEDTADVLHHKAMWDAYVQEWNDKAYFAARGAFHVSELWVRAESASVLIMSTLETLIILFVLAFIAMFVFTRSCRLSLYVVIATAFVVVFLVFFVAVIDRSPIGLIEVVAIIYFIGYALDYSLHIAYKYSSREALSRESVPGEAAPTASMVRFRRTRFALKSMGGAVLGSAMTTGGAAFFLLFCDLILFRRLGAMCLAVTVASVIVALGPLPAMLCACGPVESCCCCCCCQLPGRSRRSKQLQRE